MFSRRWASEDVPGMSRMFGDRCSSHASGDRRELGRLQRRESAEREVGHVGDALGGEGVDQWIVLPVGDVVEVLHLDDRRDRARFGDLCRIHGADAQVADQALLLQLSEHGERLGERAGHRAVRAADPQIDDIQHLDTEVAQIALDLFPQSIGGDLVDPPAALVAHPSDLRDDREVVGVRMKRLPDQPVGDVRPVEVGGVDMADAPLERLA
jgi:hypothetical protein